MSFIHIMTTESHHPFCDCYHNLPHDLWPQIQSFVCPLTLRALNKTYYKRNQNKAREKYAKQFLNFDYLDAMLIKITYTTLCDYFSSSYQCKGFTKKKIRCQRRCKDKYCHLHAKKNTLIDYHKTSMFAYLTHDVYN